MARRVIVDFMSGHRPMAKLHGATAREKIDHLATLAYYMLLSSSIWLNSDTAAED
jgi:hypothetical protein